MTYNPDCDFDPDQVDLDRTTAIADLRAELEKPCRFCGGAEQTPAKDEYLHSAAKARYCETGHVLDCKCRVCYWKRRYADVDEIADYLRKDIARLKAESGTTQTPYRPFEEDYK